MRRRRRSRSAALPRGVRVSEGIKQRKSTREGLLLGNLDEIEMENGRKLLRSELRGCFLAWVPGRRELAIVRRKLRDRPASSLTSAQRERHRRFHDAPPSKASDFDWEPPTGRLKEIGRIRAMTYSIPRALRSPEKAKYRWNHAFGDHGEHGHGPSNGKPKHYPRRFMPALAVDPRGRVYIVRKPGNRFDVKDWIWW